MFFGLFSFNGFAHPRSPSARAGRRPFHSRERIDGQEAAEQDTAPPGVLVLVPQDDPSLVPQDEPRRNRLSLPRIGSVDNPHQPLAALHPAVAEAARLVSAQAVGLISLGLDGLFEAPVTIRYSNGQVLGDLSASLQVSATLRGPGRLPTSPFPKVSAHLNLDSRASLPGAFARVPTDVLPVVLTSWSLSPLALEDRLRFLHGLDEAALDRPIAWVSVEGVGVAPAIPTLGDRRASGHSIIGLAVFEQARMRAEAVGRCWSRGKWVSWLGSA
jgi:hypothetical protein